MEQSPTQEKDVTEPKEAAGGRKRKAEALGAMLVDAKYEQEPKRRNIAPEANQLHGKLPAERIGQVLISGSGEATTQTHANHSPHLEAAINQRVETMSRGELLELSEKIGVEGTDLRRIYDTHLISERGLRRLMGEHFRGGDLKEALRRELTEHQIDFERDPVLRDRAPATEAQGGSESAASLRRFGLRKNPRKDDSDSSDRDADHAASFKRSKTGYRVHRGQSFSSRQLLDLAFITIIVILAVLIIILLFGRR